MMEQIIDLRKKKEAIAELVVKGCPQGHDINNFSCPIRNVRKLNVKNMNHYINGLSEKQLDSIFEYHAGCSRLNA